MYREDVDWLNVVRYVLLVVLCLAIISFFGYIAYSSNKIFDKVESISDDLKQYIKEEQELLRTATVEKSTAVVLDKISKETDFGGDTSISYIMTPGMIIPMMSSSPSYSSTTYRVELQLEDGTSRKIRVTKSEYNSVKVGDSVPVSIYRNDRKYELRKGSTDNIVSIEFRGEE